MRAQALLCPTCGGRLCGLDMDALFGCSECSAAFEPTDDGLEGPFPVKKAGKTPGGSHIALPFWRFSVALLPHPEGVGPIRKVYLPAFDMRRRGYFGDPGLAWTVGQLDLVVHDGQTELCGATVGAQAAEKLASYFVLEAVDRQKDVTALRLDAELTEPMILLVSFEDAGDRLVDPLSGKSYPAIAFCDIESLRSAALLRPL